MRLIIKNNISEIVPSLCLNDRILYLRSSNTKSQSACYIPSIFSKMPSMRVWIGINLLALLLISCGHKGRRRKVLNHSMTKINTIRLRPYKIINYLSIARCTSIIFERVWSNGPIRQQVIPNSYTWEWKIGFSRPLTRHNCQGHRGGKGSHQSRVFFLKFWIFFMNFRNPICKNNALLIIDRLVFLC